MLVLSYHELSESETVYRYSLASRRFANQVRLAAGRPDVRFTFDDGHISQFRYGLPTLEQHGLKATFFITAGWIGSNPMMGWAELKELVRLGHEVQAHGWHHKFMTECSPAELEHELRHVRALLEDRLGVAVDGLSLPHGRYNARVLDGCCQFGYKRIYGPYPWFGKWARPHHPGLQLIGRSNIVRETSDEAFTRMLENGVGSQWLPILRGTISLALRNTIGDRNYHRLWHRFARSNAAGLPAPQAVEPQDGPQA